MTHQLVARVSSESTSPVYHLSHIDMPVLLLQNPPVFINCFADSALGELYDDVLLKLDI